MARANILEYPDHFNEIIEGDRVILEVDRTKTNYNFSFYHKLHFSKNGMLIGTWSKEDNYRDYIHNFGKSEIVRVSDFRIDLIFS